MRSTTKTTAKKTKNAKKTAPATRTTLRERALMNAAFERGYRFGMAAESARLEAVPTACAPTGDALLAELEAIDRAAGTRHDWRALLAVGGASQGPSEAAE